MSDFLLFFRRLVSHRRLKGIRRSQDNKKLDIEVFRRPLDV